MTDTQQKLSARERARKAQAAALEVQRRRESDNLKDLEKYFKASDELEKLQVKYDADVRRLTEAFEPRQRKLEGAAAAALSGMKDRGESAAAIAAQTGLSIAQVTALTRKASDEPDERDGAAGKTAGNDKEAAVLPKPAAVANDSDADAGKGEATA